MTNKLALRASALLLLLLLGLPALAAEPLKMDGKTVRLMTIGNSFSQDATFYLDDLAKADGNELSLKTANIGGSSMQQHWEKAQLHEKDPENKAGVYTAGRGLKEILSDGPHDFVTIQQRSLSSHDLETYRPYASHLQGYVKKYAPNAELILHETWAYRVDDPRFAVKAPKAGEPKSQQEMYELLAKSYRTIAKELGVQLIPVGDAFYAADTDAKWGYKVDAAFDVKQAKHPLLPDQSHSLHVGRKWSTTDKAEPKLGMDGHHASVAGRYLGACVWYEKLFQTSCVGNKFTAGLDGDYARFLQETAHRVVESAK
ncbi:DUF4886 domain-containing protein [Anatilimnocola sp. NA78]|uniref:DUF4886 domain-containing protein n=1 Tax=Anatilimnocola sp. NA78 TaxID=3415683 RepID=UPI003CE57C84